MTITESTSHHTGHTTTDQTEVYVALGGKSPLHAPCGARVGITPLPHPARLGTGKGRQGLALFVISSKIQ